VFSLVCVLYRFSLECVLTPMAIGLEVNLVFLVFFGIIVLLHLPPSAVHAGLCVCVCACVHVCVCVCVLDTCIYLCVRARVCASLSLSLSLSLSFFFSLSLLLPFYPKWPRSKWDPARNERKRKRALRRSAKHSTPKP
jgi:hypothetical protein